MSNKKIIVTAVLLLLAVAVVLDLSLPPQTMAATTNFGDDTKNGSAMSIENTMRGSQFTSTGSGTAASISTYIHLGQTGQQVFGDQSLHSDWGSLWDTIKGALFTTTWGGYAQNLQAYIHIWDTTAVGHRLGENGQGSTYASIVDTIRGSSFTSFETGSIQNIKAYVDMGSGVTFFGQTTAGSTYASIVDTIRGSSFSAPDSGRIQSIAAYIQCVTAAKNMKAAIYAGSTLLAQTEEKSVAAGTQTWVTFNIASPPLVTAGSSYTLVVWSQSGTGTASLADYTSGTGGSQSLTYGSWPTLSLTSNSRWYSIYCSYAYLGNPRTVKAAIYSGTTLLASTQEATVSSKSWVILTFTSPPTVTQGADYVLVVWAKDDSGPIRLTIYTSGSGRSQSMVYGSWPDPASFTTDSNEYSIYCTYANTGTARHVTAAIYTAAHVLVATTNEQTVSSTGWVTFTFASPPLLTKGANYVLVAWGGHDSGPIDIARTGGAANQGHYQSLSYGSGWPSSASFTEDNYQYSLRCNYNPTTNVKAAIYSSGHAFVGGTEEKAVGADGWWTFNFPSPPSLTSGTAYVLVAWSDDAYTDAVIYRDYLSPSGATEHMYSLTYGSWPSSVSFSEAAYWQYSIYCTVQTSSGITFAKPSGMSTDTGSATVLTIDGTNSYSYSQLPYTYSWVPGSTHTVAASNPVAATTGKQYRWDSWTNWLGQTTASGTYTTPSSDTTVTANYVTQYQVTFAQTGLDSSATGTVVTVDSAAKTYTDLSFSKWVDTGSSVTYSYESTISSSTSGKQFVSTGVTGPTSPITVSTATTVTGNYKTQYQLTVTSGHDTPSPAVGTTWYNTGTSIPASVTSPADTSGGTRSRCTGWTGTGSVASSGSGTSTTFSITAPSSITWNWQTQYELTLNSAHGSPTGAGWYDSGATANFAVTSPVVGGSGTQYVCTGYSGGASGSGSSGSVAMSDAKSVTFSWGTQYNVTSGQTGVSSDFTGTVVTVNGTTYDRAGTSFWANASDVYSFSYASPLTVNSGKQYVFVSANSSSPLTVSAATTVTGTYNTQYNVTFAQSGVGSDFSGTVVTINSTLNYDRNGVSFWADANSPQSFVYGSSLTVSAGKQYVLTGVSGNATSSPLTISGPTTVTGTYKTQFRVTFAQSGVGVDFSGDVVKIDGTNYTRVGTSFWWDDTSSHSFAFYSPLVVTANGKQYVWDNTTGLSSAQTDASFVVSASGSVTGNYKTQYYLTVTSAYGTTSGAGWYNSGATADAGLDSATVSGVVGTRYVFTSWGTDASGNNYAQSNDITMSEPKTATAGWQTQYYLTVTSAHGTPSGAGWYDSSVEAHAGLDVGTVGTSGTRYVFTSWGTDASGANYAQSNDITMSEPKTATAGWQTQYEVTFDVNPGGSGTTIPSGSGNWYDAGSSSNAISASANSGYFFASWSKTGTIAIDDQASSSTTFTIDSPGTITAAFTQSEYLLTVSVDPTGGGSVLANQSAPYSYGDVVNLTATANPGYSFSHWTGDLISSSNPASITIDDNKTVTAVFTQNTYTISVIVLPGPAGGSVSADKPGPYHYGDVVNLTETPADGYSFVGWIGDGSGTGVNRTVTVTGNMDVTAVFEPVIFVVPENDLGGLLAIVACFVAFACFAGFYKRKKNYENEGTSRRRKIRFAFRRRARLSLHLLGSIRTDTIMFSHDCD